MSKFMRQNSPKFRRVSHRREIDGDSFSGGSSSSLTGFTVDDQGLENGVKRIALHKVFLQEVCYLKVLVCVGSFF